MEPSPLERAIIERTLAGDHAVLAVLREQWANAKVTKRDPTGHGVFLHIEVGADAPALKVARLAFGDVWAELPGREEPLGSVLFIEGGKLATLEMFAMDLAWPEDTRGFTLKYEKEPRSFGVLDRVPT